MNQISARFVISCIFIFLIAAPLLSLACGPTSSTDVDLGYLVMNYEKVPWPSPESVLQNLRSIEYETFDHALTLVGVPQAPEPASSNALQDTELRYAELAEDGTRQAIIGVRRDSMLYGAVAAHVGGRWQRIAAFSCWCKYESGDLLGGFIHLQAGPGVGQELVLRASGGGTGVYAQREAHFRYFRGELHLVFTFVSRHQLCDPTKRGPESCEVERRWFYIKYWDSVPGGVLVESRFKLSPETDPPLEFTSIRELELAHAQKISCKTYKWDKFRYVLFFAPNPCVPESSAH
ncbi:MAG: hypothetical protein WBE12_04630 [Candidatus Acidiferrum sp.]